MYGRFSKIKASSNTVDNIGNKGQGQAEISFFFLEVIHLRAATPERSREKSRKCTSYYYLGSR